MTGVKGMAKATAGAVVASMAHGLSTYGVNKVLEMVPVPPAAAKAARIGGSFATAMGTIWLAKQIERRTGARKWVGGWISGGATLIGALAFFKTVFEELAPAQAGLIPEVRATNLLAMVLPDQFGALAGMNDWVELRGASSYGGGVSGMGDLLSPGQLTAGESFARSVGQFHGMSEMGDHRVPMSDIRGIGMMSYPGQYGMGDWFETMTPGPALTPGLETF